jgi:SnoaL-like domain
VSKHVAISPSEAADRLAIRELVEAYAHCADRRDAKGQMALFTPDTHFVVYMNAKDPTPSQELHTREALRYGDSFVKTNGEWLFAERLLYVDWIEERALA